MADDIQHNPRSSRKAMTSTIPRRKRPHSSAFPDQRHDANLEDGATCTLSSASRSPRPSEPLLPSSSAHQQGQTSPQHQNTTHEHSPTEVPVDWDPYDIRDIDNQTGLKSYIPRHATGEPAMKAQIRPIAETISVTCWSEPKNHAKRGGASQPKTRRSLARGLFGDGSGHVSRSSTYSRRDVATSTTSSFEKCEHGSTRKLDSSDVQVIPRPRLIDALADEAKSERRFGADSDNVDNQHRVTKPLTTSHGVMSASTSTLAARRSGPGLKSQMVRRTYGSQRSMLRETSIGVEGLVQDDLGSFIQPSHQSGATLPPVDFSVPEDETDVEAGSQGLVRSIHELRRAGAINRFADEMDDLFERIGTPSTIPSSLRRNALLDLATRMCSKEFLRQFRDHSFRENLFEKIGKEEDIVSGFAIISALLAMMPSSVDHRLSKQLQDDGISDLLEKLLKVDRDICSVASQRTHRLPRNTLSSVSLLKASVLKMSVWDPELQDISPRGLALKFIDLCCQPNRPTSCLSALEPLSETLFSILEDGLLAEFVGNVGSMKRHDCLVAASILESHSAVATDTDCTPRWTWKFVPVVVQLLSAIISRPTCGLRSLELTLLKLAMNATNNNPSAAEALHECKLFEALAGAAYTAFVRVKDGVNQGFLVTDAFNRLLLILGLMINFCEHRQSTESLLEGPVLDSLVAIYLETHLSTREADSVEKSQLNVAVGYLAILLGYLSLSVPARRRFLSMNEGEGIQCLVNSIREFKAFFESVDGKASSGSHAARLEGLADSLARAPP